jgi:D-alanine-D-alanine ligase
MAKPITLALVFGGQSPEHEVSVMSAKNIFAAIDQNKYEVVLIGIDRQGRWFDLPPEAFDQKPLDIPDLGRQLILVPGAREQQIRYLEGRGRFPQVEVVFPITHGPYGEDGTLQGLFRHLSLPFVGPDVMASAVSMDKDLCKRVLREADLLVADYRCFHYYEKDAIDYAAVVNQLGLPLFIKPANMGSSVGVSKATDRDSFYGALEEAFRYDHKVIVEEAMVGRELECAVLGNGQVGTSGVGEVKMASADFYSYASKYENHGAQVLIPVPGIDDQLLAKLMLVARNAYQAVGCEGMARVDMFLCEDDSVYVNEINTLPGFTNISMYPKLWEEAGTNYPELINALIELALERGGRELALHKLRA